jgi:ArpU family phage transcriptional regulator
VSQLSLFNIEISKEAKRDAEKLMSRYKVLDAIIESRKLDIEPSLTQSFNPSESQRSNQFYSSTETLAITGIEIEEYVRTKRKLTLVYEQLKPIQRRMWEERYISGRFDVDVYIDLELPERNYYRLKREMVAIVAEAFGLIKNVAENCRKNA